MSDLIHSRKQFAEYASELLDSDVVAVGEIVGSLVRKYATRPNTAANLEALRDEALTRLMEIGILATIDPAPVLHGQPPVLEILGKLDVEKQGLDHEQKGYEINKAHARGEFFLGEHERVNTRAPKETQ